jgi:hypothetical protein
MLDLYIHKLILLRDEHDHVRVEMDGLVMWNKLYINVRYIIKYFFHQVHQYQHLK